MKFGVGGKGEKIVKSYSGKAGKFKLFFMEHAICNNMEGPRDDHTKWSKSGRERQISHDVTHLWNLKYDTNELIYETEADSETQKLNLWLLHGKGSAVKSLSHVWLFATPWTV